MSFFLLFALYRYLAMPTSWDAPAEATVPPIYGQQLEALLANVSAQMAEYSDGRDVFKFDIASPYRLRGLQPPGPYCDYSSWNQEVRLAAVADGHSGDVSMWLFPGIAGLCPSNTAWATASGVTSWYEQTSEDIVSHELVHIGTRAGGIGPHAAGTTCLTPLDGFDVNTCHARERGDPSTIMGNGSGRPTFREYVNLGWRDVSQRYTLGQGTSGSYNLSPLEQIAGIQNLSISGMVSTYNFTLRTPRGLDARWARTARVTVHGYVDGYDAYLGYLSSGERFYSANDGLSVTAELVTNDGVTLTVARFAPPTPTPGAPATPTPEAGVTPVTPPPAECWAEYPYLRCSPTPVAPQTSTPTVTPTGEPTWTPLPSPTEASSVPTPDVPTCVPATSTPTAPATPFPTTSPTRGRPPTSIGPPACKPLGKKTIPLELAIPALLLLRRRRPPTRGSASPIRVSAATRSRTILSTGVGIPARSAVVTVGLPPPARRAGGKMVEPKSNWVHVEGVECELFDQAHIPNGWMSGWGDGKTFHYHIPPPAPPRSEQETRDERFFPSEEWLLAHRDEVIEAASKKLAAICKGERWRMCIPVDPEDSDVVLGKVIRLARTLAAALEQSARDAAKKERERLLRLIDAECDCTDDYGCNACAAARVIRALPPEEKP